MAIENPLKGLKPWQLGAVIIGGVGTVGILIWQKEKAKKASATPVTPASATPIASGTATAGNAGSIEDPSTGQFYPDDSVDPDTGMTYQEEISEYGSVSAADTAAGGASYQAASQDLTPEEYDEETGQAVDGGYGTTGQTVTTNAQWMTEVESGLSTQGYTASDIGQGIAAYFASKPLGTSSDGTDLYTMMNLAVSEYGPPPTGSYPLLNSSGSSSLPGTGNATVPNVVGRTDLDTAKGIITAAGLVPVGTGDSGVGNKGSVTSQSPKAGSVVQKGSSVTLTYTTKGSGSGTSTTSGDISVPNVVGRKDLDTAKAMVTKAGLKAVSTGDSGTGNKGTVTSQDPKAGAKAAKGSTVTLTYTVKK